MRRAAGPPRGVPMKRAQTTLGSTWFEKYTKTTRARAVPGRDGSGRVVAGRVPESGQRTAASWRGAHAADVLSPAVVQPVRPGRGGGAVRLADPAGVCRDRPGARNRSRTKRRSASFAICSSSTASGGGSSTKSPSICAPRAWPSAPAPLWTPRSSRPLVHEERGRHAGPCDAPDPEGAAMVLRHEGPLRGRQSGVCCACRRRSVFNDRAPRGGQPSGLRDGGKPPRRAHSELPVALAIAVVMTYSDVP
jgi:hypothetical protein